LSLIYEECRMKTEIPGGFANKKQSGFSLIEVLIAVVILAVGIVGILQGMYSAVGVLDAAVDKTRASMLVRTRFSVARQAALDMQDLSALPSNGEFEKPYEQYRWRMQVEDVQLSGDTAGAEVGTVGGMLYKVEVLVWRIGSEREYNAATYVYIPLPQDPQADGGNIDAGMDGGEE